MITNRRQALEYVFQVQKGSKRKLIKKVGQRVYDFLVITGLIKEVRPKPGSKNVEGTQWYLVSTVEQFAILNHYGF